jgi:hypothetical protein
MKGKTLRSKQPVLQAFASAFALAFFMVLASGAFAQTNTFPNNGYVGIGTTTPGFALTLFGTEWNSSQISLTTFAGTPTPGGTNNYTPQFRFEKARGTSATPTKVLDGDRIGAFLAAGHDGSKMQRSAVFGFRVDAPTALGDVPIGFFVQTGNSSANKPERFLVKSDGGVVIKDLTGVGNRMVVTNDTGLLSTMALPGAGGCFTGTVDTCWTLGYAAIGTASPNAARLTVSGDDGTGAYIADTSLAGVGVFGVNQHLTAPADGAGVLGFASTYDYYGFGSVGRGGWVGARGAVFPLGGAQQSYFGVQGIADGGTGVNDSSVNVGVYGYANGASSVQNGSLFTGDWAVYADGEAFSTVAWTVSDARLKKNIQPMEKGGLTSIMQLQPKTYEFRDDVNINVPTGRTFSGFIAQELEEVIPEAVSNTKAPSIRIEKDEILEKGVTLTNLKIVDADQLLPHIVKAIQEQQAMIEAQAQEIEGLRDLVAQLANNPNDERKTQLMDEAFGNKLFQSVPNPANNVARIPFFLNDNAQGQIQITNLATGQIVRTVEVSGQGHNSVSVDLGQMSSGMYSYSLIVDGEVVASKTMAVNK